MKKNYKSILDYFGVSSQGELIRFINENPENKKVIELKGLISDLTKGDNDE